MLFGIVISITCGNLKAQTIFLESGFSSTPGSFFYSWDQQADLLNVFIHAEIETPVPVRIIGELKDGFGNRVGGSDPLLTPVITLTPGETTLNGTRALSFSTFVFTDETRRILDRTRMLPEGDYQLCLDILDAGTRSSLLAFPSCSYFSIQRFEAPYLVSPPNLSRICQDELINLIFQWTPMIQVDPMAPGFEQNLVMVEILPGQTPDQAIRVNTPCINTCTWADASDFLYREDMIALPDGQYAWSVRLVDHCGGIAIADFSQTYILVVDCDDGEEPDSITTDPTFPEDPDLSTPNSCGPPARVVEPGTGISLGMVLEKSELFKYPRAVPLRAEGIDFDLVKILCAGCSGEVSTMDFSVRDEVVDFNWKLDGLGSLNQPANMEKILDLQQKINELEKKIKEGENEVKNREDSVNNVLPGKIERLKRKLEEARKLKSDAEEQKKSEEDRNRELADSLGQNKEQLNKTRDSLRSLRETIRMKQDRIDSLNQALKGKPSDSEIAQRKVVDGIRKDLNGQKDQLMSKEQELVERARTGTTEIQTAETNLQNVVGRYQQMNASTSAISRQISFLQTELMKDSSYREMAEREAEWKQKLRQFISQYASRPNQPLLATAQSSVVDNAREALSSSDRPLRIASRDQFANSLTILDERLMEVCTAANSAQSSACSAARQEVVSAARIYSDKLGGLVETDYILDKSILLQIDTLREALSGYEASLNALANQVTSANQGYETAVENLANNLSVLEGEKVELRQTIAGFESELAQEEGILAGMVEVRMNELEKNRADFLEEIHANRLAISNLESRSDFFISELANAITDSIALSFKKEQCERLISDLEAKIIQLTTVIQITEGAIEQAEKEIGNQKKSIEEKNSEIEKDRKELDKLKEELENLMNQPEGKSASGSLVYYIPPPLEKILEGDDKDRFEALKDSVAAAEEALAAAAQKKEERQGLLVDMLHQTSRELVNYKLADDEVLRLSEEVAGLDKEIGKNKATKASEYLGEQREVNQTIDDKTRESSTLDGKLKTLGDETEQIKGELDEIRSALEKAHEDREKQEEETSNIHSRLIEAEREFRAAETQLTAANANLTAERDNRKGLQREFGMKQDDLARAHAAGDDAAVSGINSRISALKSQIEAADNTIASTLEPAVSNARTALKTAKDKVADENKKYEEAQREWRIICRHIDNDLKDELEGKNEELEKNLWDIAKTSANQKETEELLDNAKNRREELKTAADEDEDIKGQEEELDGLKKELEEQEGVRAKAETAVNDLLEDKDELIRNTDNAVKTANDRLDQARKELREFLLQVFDRVDFKVRLELNARDAVLDEWRKKDDDPAPLIKTLEYPKNREPRFTDGNTYAKEDLPDETDLVSKCVPTWRFEQQKPPKKVSTALIDQSEPRTIALIYRQGEPLWPEWPVIPKDAPLLAQDVVRVQTRFTQDIDDIHVQCVGGPECQVEPERNTPIIDLNHYLFGARGQVISHHPIQNLMFWETDLVDISLKKEKEKIEPVCIARELAADEDVKDLYEPVVQAGVMIEVTRELVGVPDTTYEVSGRVVTGDHQGLAGEKIRFTAELTGGTSENWGFDGANNTVEKETNEEGYARTEFSFGTGYSRFDIKVEWIRAGKVIDTVQLEAISPLRLQLHRFSNSSPQFAWESAMQLFEKGGSVSDAVAEFPSAADENGAENYTTAIIGVSGLLDAEKEFINGEKTLFEMKEEDAGCDPEEDETELFGLGVTWVELPDQEEDEAREFRLECRVEESYEPVANPSKDEKSYSTAKADKFYIGSADQPFVIVMDEPFSPNDPVSGTGRLGLEEDSFCDPLLEYMYEVPLEVEGIELTGEDKLIAVSGAVIYKWSPAYAKSVGPFNFEFESFTLSANAAASITGKVSHETYFESPIAFEAKLDPSGNFIGTISDLPEIEVKGFKLKEGTAITLDLSGEESPEDLTKKFKGIFIHQASLVMPESFSSTEDERPALSASNLYIGNKEGPEGSSWLFGGSVSYEGTLLKLGYAGYELTASNATVEFKDGELEKLEITGELTVPDPLSGKIELTVTGSKEEFSASIKTGYPVSIPQLGITMTLHDGCGVAWQPEENLGILTLNARVVSEKFGTVDIEGFELNSKGDIKTEVTFVPRNPDIEFGGGFNLHINELGFKIAEDEYSLMADGNFSFPKIGLDNLAGTVTLSSGPFVAVDFKGAKIEFEKGPVDFKGEFAYSGSEFRGDFSIGIKKILENGISAMLIVGNTPDENDAIYNYWYAELEVGTSIPLGQTGLSILSLGGGVGYNYNPPIGLEDGSPSNNDAFSFKAMMSMGNTPRGELFAGRMELVYTPQVFSLYGKVWLLSQEDALFGEGQLNLYWAPTAKLDGYVRMYIGLPDAEGSVLKFNGKINFLYAGSDQFFIKSETLEGSLLGIVNGEGTVDITRERIYLNGKVGYELDDSYDLAVITANIKVDLGYEGTFEYTVDPQRLLIEGMAHAYWDFNLDTPFGTADVTSGNVPIEGRFLATEQEMYVWVRVPIEYDVWVYSGNETIEFKYDLYR